MSWFQDFKEFTGKVTSALPKIDNDAFLQSLTLTTPELTAERERIDAEEKRKEMIRDMLAGMLPWQTRDPEREILVEECKEAILALSNDRNTFFGPHQMPKKEKGNEQEESLKPTEDSLEKLAKLEPLPPLLANFDLQAHVGLVERLLIEDPKLVKMQSTLSGGGLRERIFWKNYFFHCAYTRYEAGLSIDEIWAEMTDDDRRVAPIGGSGGDNSSKSAPLVSPSLDTITFGGLVEAISSHVVALTETGGASGHVEEEDNAVDETITFEAVDSVAQPVESEAEHATPWSEQSVAATAMKQAAKESSESGFEMVGNENLDEAAYGDTNDDGDDKGDDVPLEEEDYELDELEAEIARELED